MVYKSVSSSFLEVECYMNNFVQHKLKDMVEISSAIQLESKKMPKRNLQLEFEPKTF